MMTGIEHCANRKQQTSYALPQLIESKVIGQKIFLKLQDLIKKSRWFERSNRPIGSFIFLGQTGVGRTQLASVLAKGYLILKMHWFVIDIVNTWRNFAISRLVGAPRTIGSVRRWSINKKENAVKYNAVLY
jgi:ATP-dependent Clp protease ATP-binding subunit ClpC